MAELCRRCLMAFPHHFVLEARCTKRWRGANFDQAAAEGNVGAAVAAALGMGVRTRADLQQFLTQAFVRSYGEGLDPNPAEAFDPAVGERFEFHVGLRRPMDAQRVGAVEAAAREAIARSRHFVLVPATPAG